MRDYKYFLEKAAIVHGDEYEYDIENYRIMSQKILMKHKKCGFEFYQTPKNHLRGQGCPKCGKEYARVHSKGDYVSFVNESNARFGDRYSFPKIEVEYENSHSKVTVKCNLCGNIYQKIACDVLTSKTGGCWCQEKKIIEEKKKERKKKKQLEKLTEKKEKKITLAKERMTRFPTIDADLTEYINVMTPFPCKCKVCGHTFIRSINAFMHIKDNPCPECNKEKISQERTKTNDEFIEDMNNLYGVGMYELLGDYTKSNEKVTIKCNDCGRTFTIEANSFLQGHGCPYHNCNSSTKEKEIADYIKDITKCDIHTNDRTVLGGKELDIYIPERKIAIEFDGIFWHNENNKPNDYHLKKTEECEKNGIRLIHIFEDEWINKKEIWKSMLNNLFGVTKNSIFARKCVVKEIETKICTDFLNTNHLQGWCPSQIKLGLYYNNELVSVMTFGKSRHFIGNGKIEYELLRFCNKLFTNVVGGASKLFNYFINHYNPNSIVSYADRRWSQGNLYNKLHFHFIHNSKPNYYYVIDGIRKNRFNYRKKILVEKYNCPLEMSEREFCQQQKWYRIYDCGTMVFKWFKEN